MNVCMFICPIITGEPLNRLSQILIEDLGWTTGMFLALFWDSKLSGSTLKAKI